MVKIIKINLEELYSYGANFKAEDVLKIILNQYVFADYRILCAMSRDIDVVYYDEDFALFMKECSDIDMCVQRYAEKQGYDAVVHFFDGYEEAYALLRKRFAQKDG
jgi:hypothetical protein